MKYQTPLLWCLKNVECFNIWSKTSWSKNMKKHQAVGESGFDLMRFLLGFLNVTDWLTERPSAGFLCVYIRRNGCCCSCCCSCRAKGSAAYNMENDDMQSPQVTTNRPIKQSERRFHSSRCWNQRLLVEHRNILMFRWFTCCWDAAAAS